MTTRRINVRAIIWQNGKLLAVKHKASDGSESPYYATPGGGLDDYESLTDGVRRELMEETGIAAEVGKLLFIQQFRSQRSGVDEELEFFFHITNPDDFTAIDLTQTSHGVHELSVCEFIDPRGVDRLLPAFLTTINIENHIQNDTPALIVACQ